MKLPLDIGQAIMRLPDDFIGSFTVHANGTHEWTIEVSRRVRVKYPAQWCEISELCIDKQLVCSKNKSN